MEMTAKWYDTYYNQSLKRTRAISQDQLHEYSAKAHAKGLEWAK